MNIKKRFFIKSAILFGIIMLLTSLSAVAQYPKFYVCITNGTTGYIKYKTEWCTRSGEYCTGYKLWEIAPGDTITHWGPEGNGRMDVNIHTGGEGGTYRNYTFHGTTDSCRSSSSYTIRYNSRGFLRIY